MIDTDILIYSLKDHEIVIENFRAKARYPKSVSAVSFGELVYGAHRSALVESNLSKVRRIAEIFPVLPVSAAIMETFGELKAGLVKSGAVIADMDLIIAATALTHNLILVTNNTRHFSRIESLDTENWTELPG